MTRQTPDRCYQGDTVLRIPNLTVREQLYTYLTEAYQQADLFEIDFSVLSSLVKGMAYRGEWEPVFRFLLRSWNGKVPSVNLSTARRTSRDFCWLT